MSDKDTDIIELIGDGLSLGDSITIETLKLCKAEITRLRAENERLRGNNKGKL